MAAPATRLCFSRATAPSGQLAPVDFHRDVDKVVMTIGLDPAEVTMYCLRHSSIVRLLLANVPVRLVASLHNTSVAMIEKHYSKHIAEYGDEHARGALLQPAPPTGDNVVPLVR